MKGRRKQVFRGAGAVRAPGKRKIAILGAHPPTLGGVSIHVQRLAAVIAAAGRRVVVLDPYTRSAGNRSELPYTVELRRGLWRRLLLLLYLLLKPPAVLHLHLSHAGNVVATALLVAAGFRSRRVVTIHSGSFPAQLEKHSPIARRVLGWALRQCVWTICVSDRLRVALTSAFPDLGGKSSVIPAYLPGPPATPAAAASDGRPRVLAAGYGTATYGWHTLLRALGDQLHQIDLHLVFYTTYDPEYFPSLLEEIARYQGNITIHRDLTQEGFASLLSSSHVFVRPTLTDGDSIAVREALALGVAVVASSSCPRPASCQLFPVGDVAQLRAAVLKALRSPAASRSEPSQSGEEYLSIYEGHGTLPLQAVERVQQNRL